MNEIKTYPDGSQRVGVPPFPALSPLEQAQGKKLPEPSEEPTPAPVRRGRPPKTKEAD